MNLPSQSPSTYTTDPLAPPSAPLPLHTLSLLPPSPSTALLHHHGQRYPRRPARQPSSTAGPTFLPSSMAERRRSTQKSKLLTRHPGSPPSPAQSSASGWLLGCNSQRLHNSDVLSKILRIQNRAIERRTNRKSRAVTKIIFCI